MIELILTIVAGVVSIVVIIVKSRSSEESRKKRNDNERDKELANQDSPAISKRLAGLHKRLRIHNRKKKG